MSLSVYVHFPWCLQKCPYCDFASASIQRPAIPQQTFTDAVLRELDERSADLAQAHLTSVFFGGGTPSLWTPSELGRVLSAIRSVSQAEADDLEITVECNPSSLDQRHAAELAAVGVNRLSIGVQSLDSGRLRFLGRLHDGSGALRALTAARAEVSRVSADLMFGMPGQKPQDFLAEVAALIDHGLEHLSIYALTVEPDTQFGALQRKGRLQLAPEVDFANTFEQVAALCAQHGYEHYEVSNYAVAGQASRHNLHYWRGGAYLGLGAGAVGCLRTPGKGGRRYRNQPNPQQYMQADAGNREVSEESLDAQDTIREGLMLGLRTRQGVDLHELRRLAGVDPQVGREQAIAQQCALGNLEQTSSSLRVPSARWLHLDSIVAALF